MNPDHILSPEAHSLHTNLESGLARLRFTQPLETDFLAHLQNTQRLTARFILWAAVLLWTVFTGVDYLRLQMLAGTGHEAAFFWRSFVLRWPVLACLLYTLYIFHSRTTTRRVYDSCAVLCLSSASVVALVSAYTLKSIGMPDSSVVMMLAVNLSLFPLGVRLHIMAPVALFICVVTTALGPLMLQTSHDLYDHWVLSIAVWGNFVLILAVAYYREKGLREQFILRRLLNWEASHDPLTGLANRRMFAEHFEVCVRQAQRQQDTLYFVILDVDHFKLYNDHYGHSAGDEVLRQIARLLQQFAQRPLDMAVRLGGEEFGLLFYGMSGEHADAHLQRLRLALQELHLEHAASPTAPHVTVSMGASLIAPNDTPDTAFQRADQLLYQAKQQGRNRAQLERPSSHYSSIAHAAAATT